MSALRLPLRFLLLFLLFCVSAPSDSIFKNLVKGLVSCHPRQIQAILQFKDEFDSRGCNQTDYFNGVHCDNTTGVITKLQLPSGCLNGTLNTNSSLFKLHHLRFLNLSNNHFTSSSLHSGFGNLNKLEALSLSSNNFIGPVPSSFNNLSLLSYLDLSHNELTGSFPLVQNLTKLLDLRLSNNHFFGSIPSSLFTMPFLSILDLTENHFSGPIEIPNSSFSSRLEELFLRGNNFEGPILKPISKLINLKNLDIYFLNISHPIDLSVFSSLKSLVYLDLSGNIVSPTSLNADSGIPLNVEVLALSGCNIIEFPNILKPLQNLYWIDISHNRIKGKVPAWFWSFPHTMLVNLYNNSLNGFEGAADVLVNSPMTILELSSNSFEGPLPNLPLSILMFSARYNNFTGKIPLSVCNRNYLSLLDLSYNNFTGPIPQCLNNLQILSLRKNKLEGSIPEAFFSGASLGILDLSYNNFTGNIPLSTCNCSYLIVLELSYNNFTGTIPQCLSNLVFLNLRKNTLEGSLPDIFYANSSLRTLDVGYNQLTGKLPKSLLNCSSLEHLSVEHNRIKDAFPFWLKALPKLKVLILRSNKLYGSIDQGPLAFPKLRIFEISDNNFSGSLSPSYFVNWKAYSDQKSEDWGIYMTYINKAVEDATSIYVMKPFYSYFFQALTEAIFGYIDLQYKGMFMEQEKVFTSYRSIDLSGNRFEGQIPESIGLLKQLIALNLSNNAFTGHIPLSLANLTELLSLDFSRNQLSGTIPNGLKTLTFLAYINMSHNQLKGEIPQGTQIIGQPKSSFEGNAGLCGLPLEESCFGTNAPPTQHPKEEDEEEEEEVLSWKGVAIGYGLGVLLGLAIAQVIAS